MVSWFMGIRKKNFTEKDPHFYEGYQDGDLSFLINQEITIEIRPPKRPGRFISPPNPITIRHVNSCLSVTVEKHRSQRKNYSQALVELNQLLEGTYNSPLNLPLRVSDETALVAEYLDVVRCLKENNLDVKLVTKKTKQDIHTVQKVKSALRKVPSELMQMLT
jgi:hypothetical protein